MREIRFRAWDKKRKKMYWNIFMWSWWYDNPYKNQSGIEYDDLIFLQWTGLKDKDRQIIHEGDILSHPSQISPDNVGVVKFESPSFKLYCEKGIYYDRESCGEICNTDYFGGEDDKIIGNIYENPELIKED